MRLTQAKKSSLGYRDGYSSRIARQEVNGKARRKEQMMLKYEECCDVTE
jgi:hypothetical protein